MKIVKHIATIKEWKNVSLELNLIEWGKHKEAKYDLRCWEGTKALRGVTLQKEDLITLYDVIEKELQFKKVDDSSKKEDDWLPFGKCELSNELEVEKKEEVLDYRNIIVHDHFYECVKNGHDCEDVDAIVPIYKLTGVKEIKVAARHCKTCGAYYISNLTYEQIKENGRILCKVVTKEEYNEFIKDKVFGELAFQSILAITGYTVNSKDNLSDQCRQEILNRAINEGVYTKQKAINHINYLIKMNEHKIGWDNAVAKWKKDREYLIGKKLDKTVKVAEIIK